MRFWPTRKWKQALLIFFTVIVIAVPASFGYLAYANREPAYKTDVFPTTLTVSSVFENGAAIPAIYTAQGENVNPPLNISGVPQGTKSLVVTVTDPILPGAMVWTHWVAWNLSPDQNITANTSAGVQGKNSWNSYGYSGPDPMGTRTYYFTVYALDDTINLGADSGMGVVLRAMDNHVLAKGQLTGTSTK
jgi:Raf kinase inhibitor-like YbhB/YbcL family protein